MPKNNTPKNEWEYQYNREYNRIIQAINRQKKLGYYVPEEIIPIKPSNAQNITPEDVERLIEITPKKIRKSSIYIDKETGEEFPGLDVVNSHHVAKPSNAKLREPSAPKTSQFSTPKQPTSKAKTKKSKSSTAAGSEHTHTPAGSEHTYTPPVSERFEPPVPSAPPTENNLNLQIIEKVNNLLSGWQAETFWTPAFRERKTTNHSKISLMWEDVLLSEGEYEVAYRLEKNAQKIIELVDKLIYDSDSAEEDSFNMGWLTELLLNRPLTASEAQWYNEEATSRAMDSLRGENSFG